MLVVSELRAGTIFEQDGQLWQVLSYEHIKLGRGSATIKVKVKNLRTGTTTEKGFINGAKVNDVSVVKKEMQFLYQDGDGSYFMYPDTYEQITIPTKIIEGAAFLREGDSYTIAFMGDEALSVQLPPKVELIVTETAPGVKGNSASNVFKDAKLENGIMVKVPLFIGEGEKIRVDTRTGAYTERA
ncbi:MAG: elongation factor P [Patescibacteria group bacterium]|nr:elongation factor P [Patescibacteria group bacterium]MDE2590864.1 elongation factor P [Patescibacteria group bacterium]